MGTLAWFGKVAVADTAANTLSWIRHSQLVLRAFIRGVGRAADPRPPTSSKNRAGGVMADGAPGSSSPNWRWCFRVGLVVVMIDLLVLAVSQGQAPDSELGALLDSFDNIANIILFAYVGFRTGRLTGRATAAAEAGVVASILPGLVAAGYQAIQPGGAAESLASPIIGIIAYNIVLGGLSAWVSGWWASRSRTVGR